jgi:hypothetical protein
MKAGVCNFKRLEVLHLGTAVSVLYTSAAVASVFKVDTICSALMLLSYIAITAN